MHFTPPVQTIYAARQAIREYWAEGEEAKWERHQAVWKALCDGVEEIGLELAFPREYQSHLVAAVKYPEDPHFDFTRLHDYLYARGFTIYPGKVTDVPMFRLCSLGTLTPDDIAAFLPVLKDALDDLGVDLKK